MISFEYWPQWIYLFIIIMSEIFAIVKHGKPKAKEFTVYSVWTTSIGNAIILVLLYTGGFFEGMW